MQQSSKQQHPEAFLMLHGATGKETDTDTNAVPQLKPLKKKDDTKPTSYYQNPRRCPFRVGRNLFQCSFHPDSCHAQILPLSARRPGNTTALVLPAAPTSHALGHRHCPWHAQLPKHVQLLCPMPAPSCALWGPGKKQKVVHPSRGTVTGLGLWYFWRGFFCREGKN